MLQSARHLQALVDTILDLAQAGVRALQASCGRWTWPRCCANAFAQHEGFAQERGWRWNCRSPRIARPACSPTVSRLQQVLNNLLNNALKFTPAGRIELRGERRGDALAVSVRDTGIGMSEALQRKVFTRFHAVDGEFVHPAQGAGLGLPLCKELAALLGADWSCTRPKAAAPRSRWWCRANRGPR